MSLAGQKKDSPMTDFSIIFQRHTNAAWLHSRKRPYAWNKTNSSYKANVSSRTSRTSYWELSQGSSLKTENKRFTHDWFLNNFTKTFSCNTTRHGYLCSRQYQFIKGMLLQGHLYQASLYFPQVKFQCLLQMQTNSVYSCTSNSMFIL